MSEKFSVTVKVKSNPINGLLFRTMEKIKDFIMGADYELSLVIIGSTRSRALNKTYRKINKPTDILSFTLDKKCGEIFIDPHRAAIKAKKFERTFDNFLLFLFIHGLFHLKGFEHSSTMESKEEKVRRKFKI
ncbi:MAG: rRNA maturation RNase YbeY [Candidatus Pacebacteria bacterium]|nr:rRNA maturation RNase YbeY [Candidatus Paceibacterota bacterium]